VVETYEPVSQTFPHFLYELKQTNKQTNKQNKKPLVLNMFLLLENGA
jgi:hypothetical protein